MPADPSKGLHANRPRSVPTAGSNNCFSRSDILDDSTRAAFGSGQSLEICVSGERKDNPDTWPQDWHRKGRVLRVPKCVILSSVPFWTAWWKSAYFYGPRDVIGIDSRGNLGNYYYFEQWNDTDTDTTPAADPATGAPTSDPSYADNPAWRQFDKSLTPLDKVTVYNARYSCQSQQLPNCDDIPSDQLNLCPTPPQERYSQIVGTVENPYYRMHKKLMAAFVGAKLILESDEEDPIYVTIPEWMPAELHQVRNAFLKKQEEQLNGAHGGAVNHRPCDVTDIEPCYEYVDVCWAPSYPDVNDPRNSEPFQAGTVPWLSSVEPGFGTDVLHLYIGHACMKYSSSNSIFDLQAWPLTPEVQWLFGPIFQGSYLGDPRPFFAGRRPVWRDFGFDYGYSANHDPVASAKGLYDTHYANIVAGAANQVRENFYKYRNHRTQLFTYPADWRFSWTLDAIRLDRKNTCPATQFYSGFDFDDFAAHYVSDDNEITNCSGKDHLADAETTNYFPSKASIDAAIETFYPPIRDRIEYYYKTIEPGTAAFFKYAIAREQLDRSGVSYNGDFDEGMMTPEGIAGYVRGQFR